MKYYDIGGEAVQTAIGEIAKSIFEFFSYYSDVKTVLPNFEWALMTNIDDYSFWIIFNTMLSMSKCFAA